MTEKSTLAEALAKAQANMQNAPLNKTNPHFKSKYADLAAIRDAVTPALSANGLAITQTPTFRDGAFVLVTTLRHTGGETVESIYPLAVDKPQVMGSALTYARRYSLAAMCGIAAEEDDDANAAQTGTAKPIAGTKSCAPDQRVMAPEEESEALAKAQEWADGLVEKIQALDDEAALDALWQKSEAGLKRLHKRLPDAYQEIMTAEQRTRDRIYTRRSAA
jgi:hypothetical protein